MEFDFFFFSWKLHKNYPQLQLFIKNIPNQSLNFVWHKLSIKSVDSFPQNTITRIIFTAINMVHKLSIKSVDSFPQNTITRIIFTAINMVLSVKK